MLLRCVSVRGVRVAVLAGVVGLAASAIATPAEARRGPKRKAAPPVARNVYAPPFAAMVVDANTGREMYAVNEDEPRHPASVTKVMTLYMLFEQLERGALTLESELEISRHAAAQPPSKLYLAPGATITVEDAILALVTKSANDVAAAIAEHLGGTEEDFAERMTKKARQLGMGDTVYKNASGLPNREQVTTARDLTILARAIQERFPRYYKYFQTRSFNYAGRVIGNHNRLLGKIEGVDGIKTGFTNASGFNLMTSARLDGRHVVGVVLGGRSGASRDNIMANLIRTNIAKASAGGARSSVLAEAGERRSAPEPARTRVASADVETTAGMAPAPSVGRPLDLNAMRPVPAPPAAEPAAARAPPPLPPAAAAYASAAPGEIARTNPIPPPISRKIEARLPAMPAALPTPPGPPTRAELASARAAEPARAEPATRAEPARPEPSRSEATRSEPTRAEPTGKRDAGKPASMTPWVIQLAAEESEGKARDVLDQARSRSGRVLSGAAPFTEKVLRGTATLYRARFSGFSEADSAQEACRSLKRSGFACFATRS